MTNIKDRFQTLLKELTQGVYEKDTEIGLSLLAAIAGESVLLLGPPGVAKSMVARRVKCAFGRGKSFEYLMSRFSTPDEIFGPVSISKLKTSDQYERNTEGFMPTADVVFLDEIWKAGPAILNTLLTIINEKVFRNGRDEVHVPMKLLIGASNELPADGEGLEALWDRFLVRVVSGCVKDEKNFYSILQDENFGNMTAEVKVSSPITAKEYTQWQKEISKITISKDVLEAITSIRKAIKHLKLEDTEESANRTHNVYVSDRRWQHIAHLLRASAFVHGRKKVEVYDLIPLVYCLWNETDEIAPIRFEIINAILSQYRKKLKTFASKVEADLRERTIQKAKEEILREDYHTDDNKQLYDNYYYLIDNYDTGNTYIFFTDYKNLPRYTRDNMKPTAGIIYPDPHNPGRTYIRTMVDPSGMQGNSIAAMTIKLYRDDDHIYINGVRYAIHQLPKGAVQHHADIVNPYRPSDDHFNKIEQISDEVYQSWVALTLGNIFASQEDKDEIKRQIDAINHEIAVIRVDIQKLMYDGK